MNKQLAQLIVKLVPATCPFKRTIKLGNFKLTIPSLCTINPFYYQLMDLRKDALYELNK